MNRLESKSGARVAGRSSERGGALVLTLIAIMTVAVLGATTMQLSRTVTRRQQQAADINESFYMAEAGLAEAYAGVRYGRTGNVGTEAEPAAFGDGLFWVTATADGDGRITLESTGMIGTGRAELSMVVERGNASVATLGVFADTALAIPSGSIIDAYDSASSAYVPPAPPALPGGNGNGNGKGKKGTTEPPAEPAPPDPASLARIGSNHGIAIAGETGTQTVISADVTPGPNEDVTLGTGVVVLGTVEPAAVTSPLPPVEVDDVTFEPGIEHLSEVPLLLYGDSALEFLRIGEGAEVVVAGPSRLVVGTLETNGQNAVLYLDTTAGRIDVVVVNELALGEGASVTTSSHDTTQVSVQVAGDSQTPVVLQADGPFHGVLYAPQREIQVAPSFEVFGALVGNQLTFTGPARLHFDHNLTRAAAEAALPRLVSWRIVDLAAPNTGTIGGDPYTILGVDRGTLPTPAEAHADQWLDLVYEDGAGVERNYSGMERGFEWSSASAVAHLARDGRVVVDHAQAEPTASTPHATPMTSTQLLALLNEYPFASQEDLHNALMNSSPLTSAVIRGAINRYPFIEVPKLVDVLVANSPLSLGDLDEALDRYPAITGADLLRLVGAQ